MNASTVSAVLFAKDLPSVAAFYATALGMSVVASDEQHWRLSCAGFELVVHQVPKAIADTIVIAHPPQRRWWGAIRLDYPVDSIEDCRIKARSLGGDIDDAPPEWANRDANFYFGYDPEGNQFGVNQRT
jgi:predicted enzyme related to lactoylglutathione lyase